MPDPIRASAVFAWLYDACDGGGVELRAFGNGPAAQTFATLDALHELAPFITAHQATNVFFGVATRADATSGKRDNLLQLPGVFVDIDCRRDKPAALEALDRFPLPPGLVLDSGGGFYAVWKLREPIALRETEPKPVLRRLVATFADHGADISAAEAARVLRVPGTLNPKYGAARVVKVVRWPATDVNLSELEEWLKPEPEGGPSPTSSPRPTPDTVFRAGERNAALYQEARRLKRQGHLFDEVLALLRVFNVKRCEPAHVDDEVVRACKSAYDQGDRPGHEPRQIRLEDTAPRGTWAPPPEDAPPHGDTSDTAASDDDEWDVPLSVFLAQQDKAPPPMLVPGLLPGSGIVMPHGDPRTLKTLLIFDMALGLAAGQPVCGLLAVREPVGVLYISNEDTAAQSSVRLKRLLVGRGLTQKPDRFRLAVHKGVWLDDRDWQNRIIARVRERDARVVIFDPARSLTFAVDQGPAEVRLLVRFLKELELQTGAVVVLVHHDVKPPAGGRDERRRSHRASGGGLFSAVDAPIHLESIGEGRTLVVPGDWKFCAAPPAFEIRVTDEGDALRLTAASVATDDATALKLDTRVLTWVIKHPDKSTRTVVAGVRARTAEVTAALKRLHEAGRVGKTDALNGYTWAAAPAAQGGHQKEG